MSDLYKQITEWKNSGQFVSLVIVKKKVGRVTLYGKVISFDPPYNSILLYDEDSKSLYNLGFNEIENIEASKSSKPLASK
jgi:hypothetical protein